MTKSWIRLRTTKTLNFSFSCVWFFWGIVLLSCATEVSAQLPVKEYENRQFRFAITPPIGWEKQESKLGDDEIVVKFVHKKGIITVAARPAQDFHKETLGFLPNYNLSEKQLDELANIMYDGAPGVIDPTLIITDLSSHKALASFYTYEHRSLGSSVYMVLYKAETIRGDLFYKVEIAGPVAKTFRKANELFFASSELMIQHMRTFRFLPGKPK